MSFKQTYYTSCEKGLGGGKGFQFKAATAGIEPLLLPKIERLGLYVPPLSSPSRPSAEELKQFPISLSFQTLDNGAAILGQAKYVGVDYTGRYGNFFSHSLVSQSPYQDFCQQNKILPIETWGSDTWVYTENTDIDLPAVGSILSGATINEESIATFLSDPVRRQVFPNFLTAVVEGIKTNRRIIIVDDNENIAFWIAAASYSLPYHLVMKLTFNTYVRDPYQTEALIAGTTGDSTFNFAPHEIEHQFFVFDFKGSRFTSFEQASGFATKIAFAYESSYAVSEFARFLESCAPNLPLEELEHAFSSYCCLANIDLPNIDNAKMLGWSSRYLKNLGDSSIQNLLDRIVAEKPIRTETLEAFTNFYLAALQAALRTEITDSIRATYLRWLILDAIPNTDVSALAVTASTLPRQVYKNEHSDSLFESWLKNLKDSDRPERFAVAMSIGDKLGFTENESDVLLWLGTNVSQQWGADRSIQLAACEVANRPGGKNFIQGIAADLVDRINDVAFFTSLSTLISDRNAFAILTDHAVKSQNIPSYLRLGGTRANLDSARIDSTETLIDVLIGINKLFSVDITPEIAEEAFRAIWLQRSPTLKEGLQLLEPPLRPVVKKTLIPRQIFEVIKDGDGKFSAPEEHAILEKLADAEFSQSLGDQAPLVEAFLIAAELQNNFSDTDGTRLEKHIKWVQKAAPRIFGYASYLYELLGQQTARVLDINVHARLVYQQVQDKNARFVGFYAQECEALLKTKNNHADVLPMVVAWLTIGVHDQRLIDNPVNAWLTVLEEHRSNRDMEKIEKALGAKPELQRLWLILREERKKNRPGLLDRFQSLLGRR